MSYDLCSSTQCNICLLFGKGQRLDEEGLQQKLYKCNGCFLVVYCGKEHQRRDWQFHRRLCRAVSKILNVYNCDHPLKLKKEPKNLEDLEHAISFLKHLLRIRLRSRLNFYEEELTSFPAYCGHCFITSGLQRTCPSCRSVSYCSDDHAKENEAQHSDSCKLLRLYYCQYKVEDVNGQDIPIRGFLTRVPKLQNLDLIDAIQISTQIPMPQDPTYDLKSYQHFAFVADFSCIATICYALEHINILCHENSEKNEISLILLGATTESLWFQTIHTRFFFLQYPLVDTLSIYYIGPELEHTNAPRSDSYLFFGKKRTVNHITFKGLFQNFIHSHVIYPSLIAAFNCGFAERLPLPRVVLNNLESDDTPKNTWFDGLREILLTQGVPLLFTSFTRSEADADYTELQRAAHSIERPCVGIERILKLSQNPYRDLRPLRNWQITDREEIYYRNGYIQLVMSTVRK